MIGRVIADDVDQRGHRLVGVVQIGEAVAQPRPEMQQGRRRLVGHAPVAVGGAGDDALEQPEHTADTLDPVQGRDEMHLGGAGVGEADFDAAGHQGPRQTFSAVHFVLFHDEFS